MREPPRRKARAAVLWQARARMERELAAPRRSNCGNFRRSRPVMAGLSAAGNVVILSPACEPTSSGTSRSAERRSARRSGSFRDEHRQAARKPDPVLCTLILSVLGTVMV